MTTREEQARAVHMTWYFLHKLLNPQQTPNVPRVIREEASHLAKHYPYPCEILNEDGTIIRNLAAEG